MRRLLFALPLLLSTTMAADDGAAPAQQPAARQTTAPVAAAQDAPQTAHVFVIFTDSRPDQIIVLDEKGRWMPDVKSIAINLTIGEQPTCRCTIWSGFYKPSNPITTTWPLRQARSASPEEFQTMIDDLQSNPNALASK